MVFLKHTDLQSVLKKEVPAFCFEVLLNPDIYPSFESINKLDKFSSIQFNFFIFYFFVQGCGEAMQGADTAHGDHIRPEYRELLPLDFHRKNLSTYIFQKPSECVP